MTHHSKKAWVKILQRLLRKAVVLEGQGGTQQARTGVDTVGHLRRTACLLAPGLWGTAMQTDCAQVRYHPQQICRPDLLSLLKGKLAFSPWGKSTAQQPATRGRISQLFQKQFSKDLSGKNIQSLESLPAIPSIPVPVTAYPHQDQHPSHPPAPEGVLMLHTPSKLTPALWNGKSSSHGRPRQIGQVRGTTAGGRQKKKSLSVQCPWYFIYNPFISIIYEYKPSNYLMLT